MTPVTPAWFVKELRTFNPDLRLRWSRRLEVWQLERRVRRSLHPGTIITNNWHDSFIRAQDGYLLVGPIPHGCLSRSVFEKLRASDLWRAGGWKRMADQLDEMDQSIEDKNWKNFDDDVHYRSSDAWNFIQARHGRRILNAGMPSG